MSIKKVFAELVFLLIFAANIALVIYFFADSSSYKQWEFYVVMNVINWVYAFMEYKRGNMYKGSTIIILLSELVLLLATFPVFIRIYASYENSLINGAPPITPFLD